MANLKTIDRHDIDKIAIQQQVSPERGAAGLSSPYTLGMSMRRTFASKAMLAALSIPGLATTGCLADFLTEEELNAKIASAQCAADGGSIKDGSCSIPGLGDISEFGDTNFADGSRRGGDSSDAGTNDTIGADMVDSNDATDGKTDDGDATIVDADDATDGKTDDVLVNDAVDVDDAVDGKTDDGDVAIVDTDDAIDGTDDGDVAIVDADDAIDGKTDDVDGIIVDADDATDVNNLDAADLDGDGAADGSSDVSPDSPDTTDISELPIPPVTCVGGKPVGTLQSIPTTGPKGAIGKCKDGTEFCSVDGKWVPILSPVNPDGKETCNNIDDTCDGLTDEGTEEKKSVSYDKTKMGVGVCTQETWECVNGVLVKTMEEKGPTFEVCSKQDEDCDGVLNNGVLPKKYYTSNLAEIGIGKCLEGEKVCNPMTGAYDVSVPEVIPPVKGEICTNLVDDNCDGQTDEAKCSCDANADGFVDLDKFDPDFLKIVLTFLGKGPNDKITEAEALQIKELKLQGKNITDISGVECFAGLTKLDLYDNAITDISPLKNLVGLISLGLSANDISDISPLSGLINLQTLALHTNSIIDIQALGGMINLNELFLFNNKVTNISALKDLIKLSRLELGGNNVSDISPLAGMGMMNQLGLNDNKISNLAALAKLTGLTELDLTNNLIPDIMALINNSGLKTGDSVWLKGNPQIPASQINSLKGKGVKVYW